MTTAPYTDQLRKPGPCDHLIQLYTDEAFLGRVVGEFLGAGLAGGEAAAIIATPAHTAMFVERLGAAGLDVRAATGRGQLCIRDAQACLDQFMVDGMPDRERFFALVRPLLEERRQAGYSKIRLYGEMVDLLWNHSMPATTSLEQLWNEVLAETGVSLLCAYGIDNFDERAHRGVLHQITACHSELIPVEDYERLERAVARAYEDVFGATGEAAILRGHLTSQYKPTAKMPSPQAALFALRELTPMIADSVLTRARQYYRD